MKGEPVMGLGHRKPDVEEYHAWLHKLKSRTTDDDLAKIKEWLAIASIIVVVAGGILGGMKLIIAPLQTDIRAIHGRLDRMDGRLQDGRLQRMEDETKAVRSDMADLRERLARVETLLERDADQPDAPDAQP